MKNRRTCKTLEHNTPAGIVEKVRDVLGSIDLDPASNTLANTVIAAKKHYTINDNGLAKPWHGSVFCNPPGGSLVDDRDWISLFPDGQNGRSLAKAFWQKLCKEVKGGHIDHAIFLAFSVDLLQTSQSCLHAAGDFPVCFPSHRIKYLDVSLQAKTSPPNISAIIYVPGTKDNTEGFVNTFSHVGSVMMPARIL